MILDGATANGNSSEVEHHGGRGTLAVWGTFDGATVKLQCKPPSGDTWVDVSSDTSFTAAGVGGYQLGRCKLRLNIASGNESTQSLSAELF